MNMEKRNVLHFGLLGAFTCGGTEEERARKERKGGKGMGKKA